MGDVIMTSPALRALKETFHAKITLLTSQSGSLITPHIKEIDETIIFDLPWVKSNSLSDGKNLSELAARLKHQNFDAAVIFTVYSQSALPAALLALMAGIPKRTAYCRENPYDLLTDWIPDNEPFQYILHQVERDMNLVKFIGAIPQNDSLALRFDKGCLSSVARKLDHLGFLSDKKNAIVLHPGVSEDKRKYPVESWIEVGKELSTKFDSALYITGSESEKALCDCIASGIGPAAVSLAGKLNIEEFISVISESKVVISVNTSTIHIAAATQTPLVVLYAETNPQHTPWKSDYRLLPFSVKENLKSKNVIVRYVNDKLYRKITPYPLPSIVVNAVLDLVDKRKNPEEINNFPLDFY